MAGFASESVQHLSDATCQTLLSLVLRGSGLDSQREPPDDFLVALQGLCGSDSVFNQMCQAYAVGADSVSVAQIDGFNLAKHLPEMLLQTLADSPTALISTLKDACHLAIRLRSLEDNFAAELLRRKTESVYHFAYGLSHELNNPLANIATRAGVLAQDELHRDRKDLLDSIVVNAMRGCEMLGDLMLVARPPRLMFESLAAVDVAQRVLARAKPWADRNQVAITSQLECTRHLRVDPSAWCEAIWCLLRNAIEAMPGGGEMALLVSDTSEDQVRIEVADRGYGLSPRALEHCFDPYFSGREAGRGLGLGLAKARRIIELHDGQIVLYNRPGGGCSAVVLLPGF